jgi:glycerophosphoryl diester phosphodiesterase
MSASASESSGRIFISYRRQDSAYPAGWLYDRLADRFGADQIFKDVDSIELGDDFVETITNAVGSCDILLALIGQEWLDIASSDGTRRLSDPDDFVRLEIEAALERKVLLIPILVDGALMPRGDQLPPSIAPMVRRQALELSPNRFRADTERLLDVMERTLADIQDEQPGEPAVEVAAPAPVETEPEPEPKPKPSGSPRASRRVLLAAGAAVAALAVAALIWVLLPDNDPDGGEDDPTQDPTNAATEPPKLGGADAPVVLAHRGGNEKFAWNTLPAFDHAAKIGAAVETDVRWTKDGTAVLVHDGTTTPGLQCKGGNHTVENEDFSLLRDDCLSPPAVSGGKQYPIATLDQAVSTVQKTPGAVIYPEVKVRQTARQVRQFVTILDSFKMTDRTVITSGLPVQLEKLQVEAENQGLDDLRLMQFASGESPAELVDGLWGVAVKFDIATRAYVEELQAADLQVMVWNINTPEDWANAVDAGADIVMTDKPKEFGDWFASR